MQDKSSLEALQSKIQSKLAGRQLDTKELLKLEMLSSLEKYTKAMFKAQYHRKFAISHHHKLIFNALQDVVDGKCKRLMINMPPRYGKCTSIDSLILTTNGLKRADSIIPGDKVFSFHCGKAVVNRVLATEPALKPSVEIKMRSGRSIICSDDHPMLSVFEYKQAKDFKPGDYIQALAFNIDKTSFKYDISYPYDIIIREKLIYKTTYGPVRCSPSKNITRYELRKLVELYPQLSKYLCEDFYLDEVKSVTSVGYKELIHLEVENDHNYICNGLVSHNTECVIKMFTSWCYALNPKCKFLHLSYSDLLVKDNSATIRGIMMEPLYKTLFPGSLLEREKGSSERWKTTAGGEFYAVSTQGQVTGFGAGQVDEVDDENMSYDDLTFDKDLNQVLGLIGAKENLFNGAILIDDPMKPEDGESDIVRERINTRFESTIRNRVNSRNTPIIIIMQRLHENDLCGYLLDKEPEEWTVLSMPAINVDEDGNKTALWPMKHTVEELEKIRAINPIIFDTQYMQDPKPKEGLMYPNGFRVYKQEQMPLGPDAQKKWNYTDTADTGADSLCSICFIDTPEFLYVTDVLYTDEPMDLTEPMVARMLRANNTKRAKIESNNGGRGFGRNVRRILRTSLKCFMCSIEFFTQTENKFSRIFNWSANVQQEILMPEGWEKKWPKFYTALTSYRKDNRRRSQHDDAPDCLTGCYEMHVGRNNRKGITQRN